MSDGPFKNLQLGSRWRKFAEAVHNEAYDCSERCALAAHAIVHEILLDGVQTLFADLQDFADGGKLVFDPAASVEDIFDGHPKTSFTDNLMKELLFQMHKKIDHANAVREALKSSITKHICEAQSRFEAECIIIRDRGDMRRDEFKQTIIQANAAFQALPKNEIFNALLTGDKKAFKKAVSKKVGLNEGPKL